MTSYTLSKSSPTNTTLTDPGGTVVYEITTPFKMHDCETTIKKQGGTIATIHWKVFGKSTLTMDGKTSILKEVLPKPRIMSSSRVYTCADGRRFKWKGSKKLYCVSEDTGLTLATYYCNPFYLLNGKRSMLDISSPGIPYADVLVVTWAIMEKKARDSRGGGGG